MIEIYLYRGYTEMVKISMDFTGLRLLRIAEMWTGTWDFDSIS